MIVLRNMLRRIARPGLLALALLAACAMPVRAQSSARDHVAARLVVEDTAIAPGHVLWLDLHLATEPGWHTYWRNPGDSGLATRIDWSLPPDFVAGAIQWPAPRHIVTGGVGNYGYEGDVDLLVPVTPPKRLVADRPVTLTAKASWLVCKDICIPGDAVASVTLPVTPSAPRPDTANAALFAAARARLPLEAGFAALFQHDGDALRLFVPSTDADAAAFYPFADDAIDQSAPETSARGGDGLVITLKLPPGHAPPKSLRGVVSLNGDGGTRSYTIAAGPGMVPAAAPATESGAVLGWAIAIVLAFLGGIVLNVMPCVLPVLSIKVLAIARKTHQPPHERLRHGLAYTAGVLTSFLALGITLMALRAGGQAIGWGFQLQSPSFVALMAYLLFAMGLGLSGVVTAGQSLMGFGQGWARHTGALGSFSTGVLAAVVATPCTGPFMGTALGVALIAPAAVGLTVFAALGIGLALPFLLVSLLPGLHRILPKPGAWMDFLKQLLAFPLYGTVAWLIWVLIQEIGPGESLLALTGLVLVAFAAWLYGRTRHGRDSLRHIGAILALAGLALAIMLGSSLGARNSRASPTPGDTAGIAWQAYSPERVRLLEAQHRPFFVDLTAAWCITCIINERATLDRPAVREAFASHRIMPLKGDWTRRDPAITALLAQYGRTGVPLYIFADGHGASTVLPQILTEGIVLDAIGRS